MIRKQTPRRKKLALFIAAALILITMFIVHSINNRENVALIPLRQIHYAQNMGFEFHVYWEGEMGVFTSLSWHIMDQLLPQRPEFNPFYTDLIFVHSMEEAIEANFPPNIIAAWPRGGNEMDDAWTLGLVYGINWYINLEEDEIIIDLGVPVRPVIILEDFGLTYPITVKDLVDNWENMMELWFTFHVWERSNINRGAQNRGDRLQTESEDDESTP